MTLRELRQKYADILADEVTPDDLHKLPRGQAVFYAVVRPGKKPKDDRQVTQAGFGLPIYTASSSTNDPLDVSILGVTPYGTAKVVYFTKYDMLPENNQVLFIPKPVPPEDSNFNRINWIDN